LNVIVRPETVRDQEAIRRVNELAFGRPAEAVIVDTLRGSTTYVPELSVVAEADGQIVGYALFSEVTVRGQPGSWTLVALGPIAVLPEFQKQEIGRQLIETGLKRAAELGYGAAVLIGHPTYYPRFGFVPASRFGLKSTFQVPDDVFMARLLRPDGLDGIAGTVIYPPPFG